MTILGFLVLGILILSISLSSASVKEEKVASTTLIADGGNLNYVIGNPLSLSYWGINNFLSLSDSAESGLVNSIYLEEGNYIAKISGGAWSRWRIDNIDTEPWTGYLGDIGGQGLTWESTANIVMKNDGLKIVKFGAMGLFATKEEAEDAKNGKEIKFYHEGGNIYIFFDDYVTYDNRGSVKIDIYKVSKSDNNEKSKIVKIGFNEPIWQCSDWSECTDDVQTRRCKDLNMVEFSYNKPAEVQGCSTTLKSIAESVKVEKEVNYWFWLLVGIGIILLIIIVALIVKVKG